MFPRVRDEGDGEGIGEAVNYGQAGAVYADESLGNDVRQEVLRRPDFHDPGVFVGGDGDNSAAAIDVALHYVSSEAGVEGKRSFKIYGGAGFQRTEVGAAEGFGHNVKGDQVLSDLGYGEAGAVDCYTIADPGTVQDRRGGNRQPGAIHGNGSAKLFDYASKQYDRCF